MSDPVLADRDHTWTYGDYKEWELKPGERYELIGGVAYSMSAPGTVHQLIATALAGEFYAYLKGKPCKLIIPPFDVRLFYAEDETDDTVVQPDLTVVCDAGKLGKEGCRGAPDMTVEILSPSNTAVEMIRKRNLYLDAGVREYWVVDPESRCIEVYHLKEGRYVLQAFRAGDTVQSEVLAGLAIPLPALFA